MSFLSKINTLLPGVTLVQPMQALPAVINTPEARLVGNEITFYPQDGGERYVTKGFAENDSIYSIVSRNAEKCGQIRLYHMKVKRTEQKTAREYKDLTKGSFSPKLVKELAKMQKAMTEDRVVDSPLSKLLDRPNRNQTQSEWIENLVLSKELQGEGNLWLNPGITGTGVTEMMIIPKPQLNLVGDGRDPWEILYYEFILSGNIYRWDTENVMRWRNPNPGQVDVSLEHLRGVAPLHAFVIAMQAMNEADKRLAISNKNGGASGLVFREDAKEKPTSDQLIDMRRDFNNAVNSTEMAGKLAIMAGKWGYFPFAQSVKDQQLIEQYGIGFKRLCRIFKTPAGIFDEGNATYDNQKQFTRNWIYSKIAPMIYSLRSHLSDVLVKKFGLDPDTNLIDCDIMSLQELSIDLAEQVTALKDAYWISPNEKRDYSGMEKSSDPNMDKYYFPTGMNPVDQVNEPVGGNLNAEVNLLNG